MYKNILIISDNLGLCKAILPSIEKFEDRVFHFATSPFSNHEIFANGLQREVLIIDMKNLDQVEKAGKYYDLVISMHCKQIFPKLLIDHTKCINIHPGYNPINRGWYPQVFAIINDLPVGATIHEIDEYLDHGNIIARALVPKYSNDTSLSLYNRIVEMEIKLFEENIEQILNNTYETITPEAEGIISLKKDFNDLCRIDLEEQVSWKEAINRLRALSHGEFRNAYFIDKESGHKIYLDLHLTQEGND